MIRFLPFIIVALLVLGGLGYWRFFASKPSLTTPGSSQTSQTEASIEVPATLPNATIEDRVKLLEDLATKIVAQFNLLKSSVTNSNSSQVNDLGASVTELKARVSALENANPTTTASSKSTVYIPLGSGGGPWNNQGWYSVAEYQASLDPANYPGYSGMSLEAIFRLTSAVGTASVRLYNASDNTVASPEVSTISTDFTLKSSASFKLPTGTKNYILQIKSSDNQDMQVQSARIKVNF